MTALYSSFFVLMWCFFSAAFSLLDSPSCHLQKQFPLNGMHQSGDVILGGLFAVNVFSNNSDMSFTSEPQLPFCYGFDVLGFRQAQTMAFAINEINRNPNLLPNVTLGYSMYDNCIQTTVGFRAALSLISGPEEKVTLEQSCTGTPPVLGIVGDSSPTPSFSLSSVLGLLQVPQVSYFATCPCMSDRLKFPSFFRMIPSLSLQVRAMIQILKHFGWTWAGLLISDDDYGVHAARYFQSDLGPAAGGCLAYTEVLPLDNNHSKLRRIVDVVRTSTARVVIVYATIKQMTDLMEEVLRQNVTGLQWIASESWASGAVLQTPRFMTYLGGLLGITSPQGELSGFRDFLLQLRPDLNHNNSNGNNMVNQFWEHTFQCRFDPPPAGWLEAGGALCTGLEDMETKVEERFLDISNLRSEYYVYKAVYALAYALDDMLHCEPESGTFSGDTCAHLQRLEPWQLVHYLERANFTTTSDDPVSFDENGNALAVYDIINWSWLPNGSTEVQKVGEVKRSTFRDEELTLDEDKIFWNFQSEQPPHSVCSKSCLPGFHKRQRMGEPECCYDCVPCPRGKFSNATDAMECTTCSLDFWPNLQRDHCVPKKTDVLSFDDPVGVILTIFTVLGAVLCVVALAIFISHRGTPVVRANNSELSFVLLVSTKLCFLVSLFFMGQPDVWKCQARHIAFGVTFVLSISCLMVKTIVVLAVFKASAPGNESHMKWFGAMQQRGTVLFLTFIQAAICITWVATVTPQHPKYTSEHMDTIIYTCVINSVLGGSILLYVGLLVIICFILAFLGRNVPNSFNEAKHITFTMLIYLLGWSAYVFAHFNSVGKFLDTVEVCNIIVSCFGVLVLLFGTKCYIILFKPEKNTKKAIMGRNAAS